MKLSVFFAIVISLTACGAYSSDSTNSEITVSAAVSLKEAFTEIGSEFSAETGTKVLFNFGGSGTLQKQIESGAPADVFAAAGESEMNALAEKELINVDSRRKFASNSIVLIVPAESKIEIADFEGLQSADIKKIAIGNPKTVPAGQYTKQTFDSLDLSDDAETEACLRRKCSSGFGICNTGRGRCRDRLFNGCGHRR